MEQPDGQQLPRSEWSRAALSSQMPAEDEEEEEAPELRSFEWAADIVAGTAAAVCIEALADEDSATPKSFPTVGRALSDATTNTGGENTCSLRPDTVIIFDWDDTLLCTSAINALRCSSGQAQQLEEVIEELLNVAMALGQTYIVTNGNSTWVEESCKNWLPGLLPTIRRLESVSARAHYERLHPGNPFAWKRKTFRDILRRFLNGMRASWNEEGLAGVAAEAKPGVNLVVVGDSLFEIEAAEHAKVGLPQGSFVKTMKLKENPSVAELMGQQRRILEDLPYAVECPSHSARVMVQSFSAEEGSVLEEDNIIAHHAGWDLVEEGSCPRWQGARSLVPVAVQSPELAPEPGVFGWFSKLTEGFWCSASVPGHLTCQTEDEILASAAGEESLKDPTSASMESPLQRCLT